MVSCICVHIQHLTCALPATLHLLVCSCHLLCDLKNFSSTYLRKSLFLSLFLSSFQPCLQKTFYATTCFPLFPLFLLFYCIIKHIIPPPSLSPPYWTRILVRSFQKTLLQTRAFIFHPHPFPPFSV